MTDKDPKDMTVSEMLRLAAGEGEQGGWTGTVRKLAYLVGISDLRICELNNCDLLDESYKVIADKIDAELAEARELSLLAGAELWAKANGWPDFKPGEDFGAWLDRCAIPRPRFEDGEPVQFGELVSSNLFGAVKVSAIEFTEDGTHVKDEPDGDWSTSLEVTTSRLKRPAPEALGADGKPIVEGEKVYRTDNPITEAVVTGFRGYDDGSIDVVCSEKGGKVTAFYSPSLLTHTPSDTQERIDADALKSCVKYWDCDDFSCGKCPALIDGKKPVEFYELDPIHGSCHEAQKLDLLRRQRELDAKGGE